MVAIKQVRESDTFVSLFFPFISIIEIDEISD